MKKLLVLASAALLTAPAMAQQIDRISTSTASQNPIFTDPAPPHTDRPATPTPSVQEAPLILRNNATPTGLSGYYDYQSNGMSPHWLDVDPKNPSVLHTTYMLATDNFDSSSISVSRRVGYAYSNDGGKTWASNSDIGKLRLGFPYLELLPDGTPLIAAHGDPNGIGVQTMLYGANGLGSTNFTRLNTFPLATASNRTGDGAGVIWPAFELDPRSESGANGVFFASLSPHAQGSDAEKNPAPLQITLADLGTDPGQWIDFGDSLTTATSGGRYATATSAGGKIGLVYQKFNSVGIDLSGAPISESTIWFSESTDGGESWTDPLKIFGGEINTQFNFNGDEDTLTGGTHVDIAYRGETANVVFTGSINYLYQLQSVFLWTSDGNGWKQIALTDFGRQLGIISFSQANAAKQQPGTGGIAYPTISVADDGQHIVVAFMAMGQSTDDAGQAGDMVVSADGFPYSRLWAVGSADGGQTWGVPFILQDWGDDGEGNTDSASVEFPSASEHARMVDGKFEHRMTFQARRYPGMYAFVTSFTNGSQADRGPINECFQYFQETMLDESLFHVAASGVDDHRIVGSASLSLSQSYPNPASSHVTISYEIPAPGAVTVRIYDALGRVVATPVAAETSYVGAYEKSVDIGALPDGMYRIVLAQNGRTTSAPLNIMH